MASLQIMYLLSVMFVVLLLCSTGLANQSKVRRSLDNFEDGIEYAIDEDATQTNKLNQEMETLEESDQTVLQGSGESGLDLEDISGSAERADASGSGESMKFASIKQYTNGIRENTKYGRNDKSITSGDAEVVEDSSAVLQNENESPEASSTSQEKTLLAELNTNTGESGHQESKKLHDEIEAIEANNNAEEKFAKINVDKKLVFSGKIKDNVGSGDLDNNVNSTSQTKPSNENINKNYKNATKSSRGNEKPKVFSKEEFIKYLTTKMIHIRNESLWLNQSSEAKKINEGDVLIVNGTKSDENSKMGGQNKSAKESVDLGRKFQSEANNSVHGNARENMKSRGGVAEKGSTHEGIGAMAAHQSYSMPSISNSHFAALDKISQIQLSQQKLEEKAKLMNGKTNEIIKHMPSHLEAVKQVEDIEQREKEKKIIEESVLQTIDDFQGTNSSKFQFDNQGAVLNQTKEVRQDGELQIEKEKKLIEESILKTMNDYYQKGNSSYHDDLNPKKPSFRTRYFGKKIQKAKKKQKEDKLLKKLHTLKFGNKPSTVKKTMTFKNLKQCGLFVEEYNVSRTSASWNTKLFSQYSYLYEIPEHFSTCSTEGWFNNTDMRGSVFLSFQVKSILGNTMMNNARVCAKYCCREPRCKAWTLRIQEGETRNCDKGSYCCWLKSAVPDIRSGVDNTTSGIIRRVNTKDPPVGMRSAVPLGGLSTGSFELRADGTFHEWTIENQSPGGSAKLNKGSLDMAVLGVRVAKGNKSEAALLRTHPPHGFPGVEEMSYSGAYPVSKLSAGGNITKMVETDVYAYPAFHPRNPYTSAVPAVAFTIGLKNNDKTEPVTTSFLLNLPLGYQDDTIRMGDNYGEVVFTRNVLPADCARACAKMPKCMAWTTNGPTACLLKDKMPLHAWTSGIVSGVKGEWNNNNSMLTLQRPGFFPQSGSTTLYAVDGDDVETSFGVADDFMEIWKRFNKTGLAGNATIVPRVGLHGSASVRATLQPGQAKSLTIIMSWYYPHRDMAKVHIGNFYTNMFQSSQEVALHMRKNLLTSVSSVATWQKPFLLGTPMQTISMVYRLPYWLNDLLVNSVSFWRSAFWTKDGRWRQWEAYDCNDIDTIHNDMQRILPYMLFYPEVVRHLLQSWAGNQYSNGMMQEALTQGCLGKTGKLDYAGGRVMADSTSMFVVGVYQYYKWTNDKMLLENLWSAVKRAITWLIVESTKGTGLPFRKATFYDLAGIDKYDHHIYDSTIYVLALKASRALSIIMKDDTFKQTTDAAIARAESLIEKEFWQEHYEHYRAWWDVEYGASDWIMSDSFYGQVWANTLGLGDLVPRKKLKLHLEAELIINNTPYGLRVISTDKPAVKDEDTSLILSHRFPGCKSLENITKHDSVWMGADADWASLMINLGMHPDLALQQAKKSLNHWRSTLNDQWNIHGLMSSGGYGQDGLPWASSHHNSHLVMWHIPLAVSGQQFSAPDQSLTFWPKVEIPFELPFFVPTASGLIESRIEEEEEMFTIKVTSGEIDLKRLEILGSAYGNGEIHLEKGSTVTWSRPKPNVMNILKDLK